MIELSIIAKATAILVLGLLAAGFAQKARASVRHAIVGATLVVLLILPVALLTLPELTVRVPIAQANSPTPVFEAVSRDASQGSSPTIPTVATAARNFDTSPTTIIRIVWATGAALLLLSLTGSLWRLRQLRRTGLPWIELTGEIAKWRDGEMAKMLKSESRKFADRPVELLVHEDVAAPLTCGVLQPVIIMPRESMAWSESELRRALLHELEHVRRRDWWLHLAARTVRALYWFHPLVWVASRQLALDAERACDDAVIAHDESTVYAQQLVALARRMVTRPQPALSMANRSDLSARVSAVLDWGRPRGRAGPVRASLVALAASVLLLTIAPMQLVASVTSVASEGQRRSRGDRLDRALVEAADEGDMEGVARLLAAGANINAVVEGDGTPLIVAAREGHLALVTMLLDRGADPNLAAEGDGNPLIMAAREGQTKIVELLLDRGARVEEIVPGDENALIQASGEGALPVVKLLVARGAEVNVRVFAEAAYERPNGEWRTPLNMAQRGGHRAVVEYLISVGATQ